MEAVVEAVVSFSIELLLKKLVASDLWEYARREKIESELNSWKENLQRINEVLDDAEDKQISKPSVREWLAKLRDLAYDVDDLLDGFNYEMTRRQLIKDGAIAGSSSSKVRKFFMIPSCCNNFSPRQVVRNVEMGQKMREITQQLEKISGQTGGLGLQNLKREIEGTRAASDPRTAPPFLGHKEAAHVFGRDEDKKTIVAMLLNGPHDLSVVSIVGMGGMGKTTLADLVYKYIQTLEHFSRTAWVCVSDPFNLETVTRQILCSIDPNSKKDLQSLRQVQEELSDRLKGERFLIVLDDVWTESYDDWKSLRSPLLDGAPGSKILVTTRNRNVGTVMMGGDQCLHELNPLPEDDCWRVFQKHAFENRNVDDVRTLELIGREIVKKCGGSPLAAAALGGLLRSENRESQWNRVRDSKIWNLPCKILPALTLSYTRLPSYLKRCFAYCAIFPKDYQFDKEELIRLWMAEGLLNQHSKDDKREMEDVGSHYFDELCSRSFFQMSSNSNKYVMHDLINDLANSIAKDTCLHLDEKLKNDLTCPISQTIRHSSIARDQYETFDKFERFHNKENLRTFIILPTDVNHRVLFSYISNKVVLELIPRMRHIRVLSLVYYQISEIPDSFGELKHLRYLNLTRTAINCLPDSIGNLYNLQTLILSYCWSLTRLPISIGILTSLRCLDVRGANELKEMPVGIRKLQHLRILSNLIVGGPNSITSFSIEDLRSMPPLRGKLRISIMENVAGVQDVRRGDLKLISNLEGLEIKWEPEPESNDDDSAESVLGFLQPHGNLKKLKVQWYSAPRFPRWVNDVPKFTKMVKLSLVDCRKCEYLPCLGLLPSLEDLHIEGMDCVKGVGAEFYGPPSQSPSFKALESLSFANMPNWEEWSSSVSSFPRLRELTIYDCPKLINKLPACLPSLKELSISDSRKFESPLLGLTSLKELDVDKCNVEVLSSGSDLTSLTRLTISEIPGLINLQQGFVGFLGALQDLTIYACPEMISPWEDGGFGLENLDDHPRRDGHQLPLESVGLGCNLKSLDIYKCSRLERLPNGWHLVLTCLEKLSISLCPELVSFPEGFPPMLRDVTLENCEGLKHLPDGMMMMITTGNSNNINSSCRLECLTIRECPSLTCFPKGQLPTTLKTLKVRNCEKLDCLPDGMMCSNNTSTGAEDHGICCSQLEELEIAVCPSLTCFPNGRLPTTLKQLKIDYCTKLESLPQGIMQQHQSIHIPCLEILHLSGCSSLTSFPQGSFPSTRRELSLVDNAQLESISGEIMFHHSTTHNCSLLQRLVIGFEPNLRTLPADCLDNLTSLVIMYCEKLEFEHNQFENLTRLTSLTVGNCKNIKRPLSQWGLANLPSLQSLKIEGLFPDAVSFSDTTTGRHHHQCYSNNLPPTLTSLEISSFNKLESLASLSLQPLTSLRYLIIMYCLNLRSILQREGVFPHTLGYLKIWKCPLLKENYSREKGEYWHQVAHIPRVQIDDD